MRICLLIACIVASSICCGMNKSIQTKKPKVYSIQTTYQSPNKSDLYSYLEIEPNGQPTTIILNSIFSLNKDEAHKYCHAILNGIRYVKTDNILILQAAERCIIDKYKAERNKWLFWCESSNKMFIPLSLLPKLQPRQSALYRASNKEAQTESATEGQVVEQVPTHSWPQRNLKLFSCLVGASSCAATLGAQWAYKIWKDKKVLI